MIATDYSLNYDAQFRKRRRNLMGRAVRHASRYKDVDMPAIQEALNGNISRLQLSMNGKKMGLLDLMNYIGNDRKPPHITDRNAKKYLTHSEMISLKGIYLHHYLKQRDYDPLIIQNYSMADLPGVLEHRPLALCISSNFIYLDEIAETAERVKELDPRVTVMPAACWSRRS